MNNAPTDRKATQLGGYELVRSLGRGGMAEVFLARASGPQGFEKLVVLKQILPHFADAPNYVQLFLDEARVAACLDHPNIAQIHHIGRIDGNYCLVMEYVHGRDLRTVLDTARRAMTIDHAVRIARDIAAALHHAHERRGPDGLPLDIVHRDVSPSNIQISFEGAVKLLDFGIAKARTSTMQTRHGARKGKVGYLSPEQALCGPVDRRADVFALGIVLWEMVTGARLYDGADDLRANEHMLTRRPAVPSTLRPDCPPELDAIVMRALELEPERRFPTARALQVDLDAFARERKLEQSHVSLGELVHDLFGADSHGELVEAPTVTGIGTPPDGDATRALSPAELGKLLAKARRHSEDSATFTRRWTAMKADESNVITRVRPTSQADRVQLAIVIAIAMVLALIAALAVRAAI